MKTTPMLRLLLRHWLPVIMGTLIVAGGFFGFTKQITPTYTATSGLYFSISTSDSGSALTQGTTYVQDQMVSFNQLATAPLVLNKVIDVLGMETSVKELAQSITVTTPRDSVIMRISVTNQNPDRAAAIANAVGSQLSNAVAVVGPHLSGGRSAVSVRFIQTALPPTIQSAPNTYRNTAIGLLFGFLLSCGLVIAASRLADRVSEADSLAEVTPAPLLGRVRRHEGLSPHNLVIVNDPTSRVAEDFRQLRANVEQLSGESSTFMIAIASALRSEGRSTVSANLAAALAESGRTVVLLEADFRNPQPPGGTDPRVSDDLASALADPRGLDGVLHRVDEAGFDMIAAGGTEASPIRMLSSAGMELILMDLRRRYEFVLVDAPALLDFADVTALRPHLNGLLLLADGQRVRWTQLRKAQQVVDLAGIKTLGIVMNQVPTRRYRLQFPPQLGQPTKSAIVWDNPELPHAAAKDRPAASAS